VLQNRPSAWKPGEVAVKPGSTTSSQRPPPSAGLVTVSWNQRRRPAPAPGRTELERDEVTGRLLLEAHWLTGKVVDEDRRGDAASVDVVLDPLVGLCGAGRER